MRVLVLAACAAVFIGSWSIHAGTFSGNWRSSQAEPVAAVANGEGEANRFAAVGEKQLTVWCEPERALFRPRREEVWKKFLSVEVELDAASAPVSGGWFVKDKDGFFFQSRDRFQLQPGEKRTLTIALEQDANAWRATGHRWPWNSTVAATCFAAGLELEAAGKILCRIGNLRYEGERAVPPLQVLDWTVGAEQIQRTQFESRFRLSREYFNPFDPEEIAVDALITAPDGGELRIPAFFYQNFERTPEFSAEKIMPIGMPAWAFRFTPPTPGEYRVRLEVTDAKKETVTTEARKFAVKAAGERRGFVRVDERTGKFFRFDNGEPFYPVGLNIHTNIDLRSESAFGIPPQSDGGTYDYDAYLNTCAANGISTVEIWMSAWAFALEWDSARSFYYGMGRYNLANAWRLDYMMQRARELGIYYHLVIDNHGKITERVDPEWFENPLNAKAPFAVANGGVMDSPAEFFTHSDDGSEVAKLYLRKLRYIGARWGADPAILGFEFWNEVNLTDDFLKHYDSGVAEKWHGWAAEALRTWDSGKHLLTTHVSNDYTINLHYRRLWENTPLDYIVGDAYYNVSDRWLVDIFNKQSETDPFTKPIVVTEFGGAPHGGKVPHITGDIRAGLWSSYLLGFGASPFLWWHDFVLKMGRTSHYRAFSQLTSGIDRGDPAWQKLKPAVNQEGFESFAIAKTDAVFGWLIPRELTREFPAKAEDVPVRSGLGVHLATPLPPGKYRVEFFDPGSGEKVGTQELELNSGAFDLTLPEFRIDLVYHITAAEGQ